ncbi:hypothetical protein IID24_03220 [Patescibacteria group bacterium]|nr:hypothetical protein [Patescibacteria group bacterium]
MSLYEVGRIVFSNSRPMTGEERGALNKYLKKHSTQLAMIDPVELKALRDEVDRLRKVLEKFTREPFDERLYVAAVKFAKDILKKKS